MLFTAALAVLPGSAWAYDLKTTSTGAPVRWHAGDVEIQVALGDAPAGVDGEAAQAAVIAALETWQVEIDGEGLVLAPVAVSDRLATDMDSRNTVRWGMGATDPDIEVGVLAMTYVSYRTNDGAIRDADIVVNAAEYAWFTGDLLAEKSDDANDNEGHDGGDQPRCERAYDLETTMVHEAGHLLGLSHSDDREAIMFPTTRACSTHRTLGTDDQAAVRTLYEDLPPFVADEDEAAGCSAASDTGSAAGAALVLLLLAAARLLLGRGEARQARQVRQARRPVGARRAALLLAGLGLTAAAAPAEASQLRWLGIDELAAHADLAARGRVLSENVRRGARGPETVSTVAIDECLSGSCPRTLTVVRRGGEIDGEGLWIESEAALSVGDEVVLFARQRSAGQVSVVGGVQGAFRVHTVGTAVVLERNLGGQHVRMPDGRWAPGAVEALPLAQVRAALAARR
jgi:hypothetical protein